MKTKHFTILVLFLTIYSCQMASNSNDPKLVLKDGNPYELTISNFTWNYSQLTGTLNGNFDVLDQKVYELLKGREGMCEVYLIRDNSTYKESLGLINIQHINDSPDWLSWRKRGIESMLTGKIQHYQQPIDSAKIDSSHVDSIAVNPQEQPAVDSVTTQITEPGQPVDSVIR